MKRIFLPQDFLWFLIPVVLAGILIFLHFFIFSQTWTKKGIHFIKQKKPQSAVNLFVKILEREPFHPYAHLNLGLAYGMSDRPMKALKEYGMILKHFNQDSLQFFASFNKAELHGHLGDLEKALENYQRALAFSIEQDKIKQNIELLFKNFSQKDEQGKSKMKGQQSKGKSGEGRKGQEDQNTEQEGKSAQNESSSDSSDEGEQNMKKDEPQEDSSSSKEAGGSHSKQQDQPLSENGSITAGEISKTQAQSIMDEIEEQESNVRARQFQQNSLRQPRRNTNKDW